MADLRTSIGKLELANPVMTASGTFGYGTEFADFVDLNRLGGVIVKGTTLHHREGNPYPRMAETPSGMLNAVGLQNKGVDYFCEQIYPTIKDYKTNMIVNVSGSAIEDYVATAERINALEAIPAIELNISCPNVKQGGMAFGVTAKGAAEVVSAVRKVYDKTLIVKLSPNVTDITEIARAAESATVRTGHGTTDWFQIGKGVCQGCILLPCLFNLYAEYIMRNGMDEALESRLPGEISITSDMQMTSPLWQKVKN